LLECTKVVKGVEIVAALGHPKSNMSTILKEFERHESVEHPKSTRRPQKLSEKSVRIITCELVQDRRQTLVDITNRSGINVSASIVRKALHDISFYSRIAQKKPFLFDTHRVRNLEFAREHRTWTIEDWKKVIWTNESTFEVDKSSRQILVWRKSDECYKLHCLIFTFKLGHDLGRIYSHP
jgi:hypothetical protein